MAASAADGAMGANGTAGDGAGSAAMTVVVMLTMMLIVTATVMVIEADSAADGVAGRAASVWKGALRMQPSAPQMAQPSDGAFAEEPMVQLTTQPTVRPTALLLA